MAFNRSKFKGSSVKTLSKQQKEVDGKLNTYKSSANYLDLQEGKNKIRIYPAHPKAKSDVFCFPKVVCFVEATKTRKNEEGKEVSELKRFPVFNSRIHGNTLKDILEEYISLVKKTAYDTIEEDDDRKTYLGPINSFKTGLKFSTKWVVYGDLYDGKGQKKGFGRIELPTTVKDRMNEIAEASDDPDQVIEMDPFTCPDEGRRLIVTYDKQTDIPQKQRDPKKYYSAALDWKNACPLTDDQLEKFEEMKSLEELFSNVYTRRDFETALEGIYNFDSKSREALDGESYGICNMSEWKEIEEEISEYYGEEDDHEEDLDNEEQPKKRSSKTSSTKKVAKPTRTEEVNEDDDEEDDLPFDKSLEKMSRSELKGVIRREQLGIKVGPQDENPDIVEMILEAREEKAEQQEEDDDDVEEELERRSSRRRGGRSSRASKI